MKEEADEKHNGELTDSVDKPDNKIGIAVREAAIALREISDAPYLDAQWLLLAVLKKEEASWLIAHSEAALNDNQLRTYNDLIQRRIIGEPLAYILGEWHFYGRKFLVDKNVLIPRPSTESLVDEAWKYIRQVWRDKDSLVIADVGTGSGCVIITLALQLAKEQPVRANCQLIATDISAAALVVAQKNARRYGVTDRIEFIRGDFLQPLVGRKIDLLVSNPPYVPTAELVAESERQEVKKEKEGLWFEPTVALDGGGDGLRFVRQLKRVPGPVIYETIGGKIEKQNIRP